jgi:uncharacterized protein YeaO (DUF488 family)
MNYNSLKNEEKELLKNKFSIESFDDETLTIGSKCCNWNDFTEEELNKLDIEFSDPDEQDDFAKLTGNGVYVVAEITLYGKTEKDVIFYNHITEDWEFLKSYHAEIEEKFDQTIDLDGMSTDYKVTVVKCSSKDFSTQDLRYIKSDIQGYFDQGDYIFENFDVHKNSNIKNKYNKELNEIYDDINALAIKKDINEDELTDILCIYSSLDDARKHYRG